jgi:hypothetical protein
MAACLGACSSSDSSSDTGAQTGGSAGAAAEGGVGGSGGTGGALPDSGADSAAPDGAQPDGAQPDGAQPGNQDAGGDADAEVWTQVGGAKVAASGTASHGRLVVAAGTPYAAFADSTQDGKITVMKVVGNAWTAVGAAGISTGGVDPNSLALAVDNATPYVAFQDAGFSLVTVMKYSGTSWVLVGTEGFATAGNGALSLLIQGGIPYVTFVNDTGVHVMSFGGTSWAEAGTGLPGSDSAPIFGTDGSTLYVAFNETTSGKLTLFKLTGSAWTSVATSDATMDESWAGNINFSSGTLFVTYYNSASGAVVLKLVGSALQSVGDLGSISGADPIEFVSGTVYNGVPYVAFDDEAKDSDLEPRAATVKYWDGTKWAMYQDYPNLCDIENTLLYADQSNGNLYLTYSDCDGDMTVQVR